MNEIWKIGLVGVRRGSSYGRLLLQHPRFEIAALCDSSAEALSDFQQVAGLPDSQCFENFAGFVDSEKFDAVILSSPITYHAQQAVAALDAGKHVLSEVTAADSVEGCTRIIEATRRNGRVYMLAENMVYTPMMAAWHKIIDSGKLGSIIYAEADYLHPIRDLLVDEKSGRQKWRSSRPPVHYCSHSLGPILYLTQDRIVRAMAIGDARRIMPSGGVGAIDVQLAAFETKKGMIIKMTRTQVALRHYPVHYWHLLGTRGFVETDRYGVDRETNTQGGLLYIDADMEHSQKIEWQNIDASLPDYASLGGHGSADYRTLIAFLGALDTGRRPALDEVKAWDLTVPGLVAAQSAAAGGAWMDVPAPELGG